MTYETLTFNTERKARKNQNEIKNYFGSNLLSSEIIFGKDEMGNDGYYIKYTLSK